MQVLPKARQGKKKAGNKPADYRKASFASQRGEAADQQTTPASHSPDSRSCTHLQVYPQAPFRRRLFRIRSRVHGAPGLSIYVFSSLALPTAQAIVPLTASAAISLSLCSFSPSSPRLAPPRPAPPNPQDSSHFQAYIAPNSRNSQPQHAHAPCRASLSWTKFSVLPWADRRLFQSPLYFLSPPFALMGLLLRQHGALLAFFFRSSPSPPP